MQNEDPSVLRVALVGVGSLGCFIVDALTERSDLRLTGALDTASEKRGKSLSQLTGCEVTEDIVVTDSVSTLVKDAQPDIAFVSTSSFLADMKPLAEELMHNGVSVISTCEELVYPWMEHAGMASELHQLAHQKQVGIMGIGVNPGFLMDLLPLVTSSMSRRVDSITAERIIDASKRRKPFLEKIGAGVTSEEFDEKTEAGKIGHVGLKQSVHMLSNAIGIHIDCVDEEIKPVFAHSRINTSNGEVIESSQNRGICQVACGYKNDQVLFSLVFRAAIGEPVSRDRIVISGTPPLELLLPNGVNGDIATSAIVVNAIRPLLRSGPGLHTVNEITPFHWWADIRGGRV